MGSDADAYLDFRFLTVGYGAQFANSDYFPSVAAKTQLVDATSNNVLYAATLHYGDPWRDNESLVQLELVNARSYQNIGHLVGSVDDALIGFMDGAEKVVDRVCKDLP